MNRHYYPLWSVLFVTLVAIAVLSVAGDITFGPVTLKSSGLVDALIRRPEQLVVEKITELKSSGTQHQQAAPAQTIPAPVDTTRQTILFAGDSMVEGLFPRLAAYCEESGHDLYAVIWYSSGTELWANTKLLSKYIADLKPTYIIVSLGGNELFIKDVKEKRTDCIKSILKEIGNRPYLWIGPPNWKPDTGINDLLESLTDEGCFFLSNGMKFQRKKDGAHPTAASSAVWMDSIVRWMPLHCAHPIKMTMPAKEKAKAKRVFLHQPGPTP